MPAIPREFLTNSMGFFFFFLQYFVHPGWNKLYFLQCKVSLSGFIPHYPFPLEIPGCFIQKIHIFSHLRTHFSQLKDDSSHLFQKKKIQIWDKKRVKGMSGIAKGVEIWNFCGKLSWCQAQEQLQG